MRWAGHRVTHVALVALVASAVVVLGAGSASGAGGTLTFDTGVVADGARIDNQFRFAGGTDGLRFAGLSADLGWPGETDCGGFGAGEYRPLLRKFTGSDTFSFYAHSGARGIESATNNCSSGEFGTGGLLIRCTVQCLTLSGSMGIGNNTDAPPVTTGDPTFTASGYDAAGTLVLTVDVPITSPGALNDFTLDPPGSAAMTFVKLRSTGALNTVIADDLSYTPDPTAQPTVTVSSTSGSPDVHLAPGSQVSKTYSVVRGNGSDGTLVPQLSSLPGGVTAQIVPTSFAGTDDGTLTITYTAGTGAATGSTTPVTLSVTADPGAGTPNEVDFTVQVDSTFEVPGNLPNLLAPSCTKQARRVTFFVRSGQSYSGPVDVTATTGAAGWSAGVLNGTVQAVNGIASATLLYSWNRYDPPFSADIVVSAHPSSRPTDSVSRTYHVTVDVATITDPAVTVTPPLGDHQAAVDLQATGSGFCAGSTLKLGNDQAVVPLTTTQPADAQLGTTGAINRQTITAPTPRYATSGTLGFNIGFGWHAGPALQVRGFRNTAGFVFHNYPVNDLVYDDMTRAFGEDQTYMHIGPFVVRDPVAMFYTAIVRAMTVGTDGSGHCFGIALTEAQFKNLRLPPLDFPPYNASDPWLLTGPDPGGPSPSLLPIIQANHLKQFGLTFLDYYLKQVVVNAFNTGPTFVARVQAAINAHGGALLAVSDDGGGHVVLAHSIETVGASEYWIDVADSNWEHTLAEDSDLTGVEHKTRLDGSRIHIQGSTWTLVFPDGVTWSGNVNGLSGGTITLVPFDEANKKQLLPSMLSIPQLLDLLIGFGSTSGATTVSAGQGLVSYSPDNETTSAGLFLGPAPKAGRGTPKAADRTVSLASTGTDTVTGVVLSGGTAVLSSLKTTAGADVTAHTVDHGLSLSADKPVPLELQVARGAGQSTLRTTIDGRLPAHGSLEVAQTKAGLALDSTKATRLTLTTTSSNRKQTAATRVAHLDVPAGKHVMIATAQLKGHGSTIAVRVGTRTVKLPARTSRLGKVDVQRVAIKRHGKTVVVTSVVKAKGQGNGTVVLELSRNGKVVATTTRKLKASAVRSGKPVTIHWKVTAPGRLTVRAQAALAPDIGTDGMVVSDAVSARTR